MSAARRVPILFTLLAVSAAGVARAQIADANPHFETAAIHPSAHKEAVCFSMSPQGSTHFDITCMPLRMLVQMAFGNDYVDGKEHALDALYDLRATTPEGIPWTTVTVRPMLRQLLAERFHLVHHTETKVLSGYEMTIAPSGSKLVPAAVDSSKLGQRADALSAARVYSDHIVGQGISTATLAGLLGRPLHGPVTDSTGLHGVYDVELHFAPDSPVPSDYPAIFAAVKEQLGLEVKPAKVPVTTLVIDHADTTPTDN